MLKENKIKIEKKIVYPDHYNYKFSDIDKIKKIAKENKLKILTTEKDFTKINKFNNFNVKFTNIDLYINNYKSFKRFIINNLWNW